MGIHLPAARSLGGARRAVTLASAVCLIAAPVWAQPASAATTVKDKVVKIAPKQFPRLLDRPGTGQDVLRFTLVPGAQWALDGKSVDFKGVKTIDMPVTDAAVVTITPDTATATTKYVLSGPTSWSYTPTDVAKEYTAADISAALTWIDLAGTKSDAVVLTKLDGITWEVAGVKYDDAKFGAKTALTVKLKENETVTPKAVGATLAEGAEVAQSHVTKSNPIEYTADQLGAAVAVGDNPFDATKGVGKAASVETVKITGLAGISWKVAGSTKGVSVKPGVVAYLPVSAADVDDNPVISVTPVAASGYTVPKVDEKATPVSVDFTDKATAPVVTVAKATANDNSGTVADTLSLPVARGMTWYAGQKDAKGKMTYTALKADKTGNAVYKVKFAKDSKEATVSYRAVPDRGYTVSDVVVKSQVFKADETVVTAPAVTNKAVTLTTAQPGVASWDITVTSGEKDVKTSYKPAELAAAGVKTIVVPATTIDIKVAKGYKKA